MSTFYELKPISKLFPNVSFVTEDTEVKVGKNDPFVPLNPFYVPQIDILEDLLVELTLDADGALGLVGETGTGKTEMVRYISHYLRRRLATVQIHCALRPEQIEGGMELRVKDGCSVSEYVEQAVVECYRDGGIVFFDEIDKASPELSASLHAVIDNKPWTLSNGTIVQPHPDTRVIVAANTIGDGASNRYITSQQLDSAIRSRISWTRLHYPSAEVEIDILRKQFSAIPISLASDLVKVANALRDALLGVDRLDDATDPVGEPFSTRTLVKWCSRIVGYKKSKTLLQTFYKAFLNGVSIEEHEIIIGMLQRHLTDDKMNSTLAEISQKGTRPVRGNSLQQALAAS